MKRRTGTLTTLAVAILASAALLSSERARAGDEWGTVIVGAVIGAGIGYVIHEASERDRVYVSYRSSGCRQPIIVHQPVYRYPQPIIVRPPRSHYRPVVVVSPPRSHHTSRKVVVSGSSCNTPVVVHPSHGGGHGGGGGHRYSGGHRRR